LSNKLLAGIIAGAIAGISAAVIFSAKRENDLYEDEDQETENDNLDRANEYLIHARTKAEKMISDAAHKSSSILEEAGKILSLAKTKTSSLHFDHRESALEEIRKLKKDIENTIEDFKRKLDLD